MRRALDQLPDALRARIDSARTILADAETPEGRAFHAADVVDRVMQIDQHLRGASVTMAVVLDDMGLVHDGPFKAFHEIVLAEMGLP
jgi:fumarate hydratase class II